MKLRDDGDIGKNVDYGKKDLRFMHNLNLYSSFFIFFRAYFILRVIAPLRPYLRMIKEVIKDLPAFTILLLTINFLFSIIIFMIYEQRRKLGLPSGEKKNKFPTYPEVLKDQVDILSTGGYGLGFSGITTSTYMIYLMAFYISIVVMLNLLISVIGEKFGVILEQTIPMDCVERSSLMMEIEGYASFIKGRFEYFQRQSQDQYIHYVRYRTDQEEQEDANVDVEGRMRVMQQKLTKMKDVQDKRFSGIVKTNLRIDNEINTKISGINKVLTHLQRKIDNKITRMGDQTSKDFANIEKNIQGFFKDQIDSVPGLVIKQAKVKEDKEDKDESKGEEVVKQSAATSEKDAVSDKAKSEAHHSEEDDAEVAAKNAA